MSLDASPTLGDRFHTARGVLDCVLPRRRRVGRTYQGFIKALKRAGTLHLRMQALLRDVMPNVVGRHWKRYGWVMFAVDGTKIDCVRSSANEEHFGVASKAKSHPQQVLTTLYHMGTGLPWAWVAGRADASERGQLREMIDLLPQEALIVADAGFTGFDLLGTLQEAGQFFLVRVGGNVKLLKQLGFATVERNGTVYLWPTKLRDRPPLVLRLIKVPSHRGRNPVYMITNVLDHDRLNDETAGMAYQMRWGVEVFHRSIKQTLGRRKMRSAAPTQATLELHWTIIGLLLLGLLTVSGIVQRKRDPRSWSVACALRIVRRCLHAPTIGIRTLMARLAKAVTDTYQRTSSKKARNWPHKKSTPDVQPPLIRSATRTEVKRAQTFVGKEAYV